MKQTFITGDLPIRVVIEDGQFTERDKKILRDEEIADMKSHPEQIVFFRRYRSYLKAKSECACGIYGCRECHNRKDMKYA